MIYFVCALYIEARPLIKYYNLKRDMNDNYYQIFTNENISLIITGSSKIACACGVSHLLSGGISPDDIIFNVGICGSRGNKIGKAFLINKITDNSTKREYFTDILIKNGFDEGCIETFEVPVNDLNFEGLCDMESSGFFQAASKYLPSHLIQLVKIVSDNLNDAHIQKDMIEDIINQSIPLIDDYIKNMKSAFAKEPFLNDDEKCIINRVNMSLKLTESEKADLKKHIISYKIRNGNIADELKFFAAGEVKTKNDSKKQFRKLIEILSE